MDQAWQTIRPFLTPYRWRIALVFSSVIAVTGAGLLGPWLIREMMRVLRVAGESGTAVRNQVIQITLFLLGAYAVRSYGQYLSFHHSHVVAWNVCHDLRSALYTQLQRFSPAYYAERQTGEVVSRVVKDTDHLEPLIADVVYDFLATILVAVGVLIILIAIDPFLTLLSVLPIPLIILVIYFGRRPVFRIFKAEAEDAGEVSALVQDNISGLRDIQIYNREDHELERVTFISRRLAKHQIRARQIVAAMFPLIEGSIGISAVLIIGVGGLNVLQGTLEIEDLVIFLLYLAGIYQPLWKIASVGEFVERGIASLGRIREVLTTEPDVSDSQSGKAIGRADGTLILDNVSFAYKDEPVLTKVSVELPAGQMLAVVGPTGAGKSTLASLLTRFYDPQGGRILLDGHDLREIQLDSLRRNLGIVQQDVFLFYASVGENIRFAKPDASDEEVKAAAKIANAHEFISQLPEGYDTLVGERGIKLSGGQKQRISIARAILKDAPILIFDEATSAVDTGTEAQIQAALTELMDGRTSIVIAHRLSTVRNADQIMVLDEGQIVQLGPHDILAKEEGLYARLLAGQAGESIKVNGQL